MKPVDNIEIIDYKSEHHHYFREFNREWIEQYFVIEDIDNLILDEPGKYILEKGGYIFMAKFYDEIVGTSALIKIDDFTFELAKMAVLEKVRGKGIGLLLGNKCIEVAKQSGIKKIILLSNTILTPAINLYRKLGFREVELPLTNYKRANIKMQLDIQ